MDRSYKLMFVTILVCSLVDSAWSFPMAGMLEQITKMTAIISKYNFSSVFNGINNMKEIMNREKETTTARITQRPLPKDVSFMGMTHAEIRSKSPTELMEELESLGYDTEYLSLALGEDYTVEDIVYGVMRMMGGYDPNGDMDYGNYFSSTPNTLATPITPDIPNTPATIEGYEGILEAKKESSFLSGRFSGMLDLFAQSRNLAQQKQYNLSETEIRSSVNGSSNPDLKLASNNVTEAKASDTDYYNESADLNSKLYSNITEQYDASRSTDVNTTFVTTTEQSSDVTPSDTNISSTVRVSISAPTASPSMDSDTAMKNTHPTDADNLNKMESNTPE